MKRYERLFKNVLNEMALDGMTSSGSKVIVNPSIQNLAKVVEGSRAIIYRDLESRKVYVAISTKATNHASVEELINRAGIDYEEFLNLTFDSEDKTWKLSDLYSMYGGYNKKSAEKLLKDLGAKKDENDWSYKYKMHDFKLIGVLQ